MQQKGRIIMEGMGGFLCPPSASDAYQERTNRPAPQAGEPHLYVTGVRRGFAATGRRHAGRRTYRPSGMAEAALDSPDMQEWILQVLGYFKGCFNFHPENESGWHAGNLTIDSDVDPLEHADFHAGVHLYPPATIPNTSRRENTSCGPTGEASQHDNRATFRSAFDLRLFCAMIVM